MSEFRYKAFISYSHQDEAWARWLQRALESYRVPRRLVGSPGQFGDVAARVSPVFRDREDLSSASDLSTSVRQELEASETLIVICSPAAAASRWVNEEIRYFRMLGRRDRVLALIVDGDPSSDDPESACFPPALVESEDGAPLEPLAADARKWADGRSLARLKLVAGILGIRLDDLRRRDMQRKHRLWMFSSAGAVSIAIITSVLAIVAVTARNEAENRRQHAENLVDYMVDDLKEKLDEVGRLDILQGVGGEVSKYLETLNPREETEESLLQKAKVWRQLGEVEMSQGRLDEAMAAFEASREVTRELLRRSPTDLERVYEMGQAEFWVGYVHLEKGQFDEARQGLENYLEYSNRLAQLDPGNPDWIMEQSYAHGNIAALINRQGSGDAEMALEQIKASVDFNRQAIEMAPDNQSFISEYGEALAWQADTQMLLCDLGGALKSRQENFEIARRLLESEPANANFEQRYAFALSGLAKIALQVGLLDMAKQSLVESFEVLGRLYRADPSNLDYRWEQLDRQIYIAELEAEAGEPVRAASTLQTLYAPMLEIVRSEGEDNQRWKKGWVSMLLHSAEVAWMAGESQRADELWTEAVRRISGWLTVGESEDFWRDEIITAKFLRWHYAGQAPEAGAVLEPLGDVRLSSSQIHTSCESRHLLVLQALVDGDRQQALRHTSHLLEQGYFDPGFIRICRDYELCQGRG